MLSIENQLLKGEPSLNLRKPKQRAHILEGLVKDRIDDVIEVGKGSASREQFENVLKGEETFPKIAPFDFTEPQAKAIIERRSLPIK